MRRMVRVLLPVDFSASSLKACEVAVFFARQFGRNPKQIQNTNFKNSQAKGFLTFEIQISDLFLISCFGFRISDLVKTVN